MGPVPVFPQIPLFSIGLALHEDSSVKGIDAALGYVPLPCF